MKKVLLLILLGFSLIATSCSVKDAFLKESDIKASDFDESGDVNFAAQYTVYDKNIETIICLIQNNTEMELSYGAEYSVERKLDESWYQIPFKDNTGWDSLAYLLPAKSAHSLYINLTILNYNFIEGTYRVVKAVGDKKYYAIFELGESLITADTPYGFQKLDSLEIDYKKEQAIKDGVVVVSQQKIANVEKIDQFVENTSLGIESLLRILETTVEGDPILWDITYKADQGGYYTVDMDNRRDQYAGDTNGISQTIYSYMITDGTYVYLSNYAVWDTNLDRDTICLLNGNTDIQWESMIKTVKRMTKERVLTNTTSYKGFSEDGTKYAFMIEEPLEFGYNNGERGEIRSIENKMNIAKKIRELVWVDDFTLLLVCETDSEEFYYEFFDTNNRIVTYYTVSRQEYKIEDGEIIIPE